MQLSYKDIQFTIEAIDNLLNTHETKLEGENIDEDEAADLGNDCMFLESLRDNLATNLKSDLTQTQPQLSTLAIDDYRNDPELTIFTSLDGSDFLE